MSVMSVETLQLQTGSSGSGGRFLLTPQWVSELRASYVHLHALILYTVLPA